VTNALTPESANLDRLIDIAKEDLVQRLDITSDEIDVLRIEKAEWPDTNLGCAESGLARRPVSHSLRRQAARMIHSCHLLPKQSLRFAGLKGKPTLDPRCSSGFSSGSAGRKKSVVMVPFTQSS